MKFKKTPSIILINLLKGHISFYSSLRWLQIYGKIVNVWLLPKGEGYQSNLKKLFSLLSAPPKSLNIANKVMGRCMKDMHIEKGHFYHKT